MSEMTIAVDELTILALLLLIPTSNILERQTINVEATEVVDSPSFKLYHTMVEIEQKEKNKQYILNNLDKYIIDVHGNFFNVDPEMLGEGENASYCYIGKNALTPEGIEKIVTKICETILQEMNDWELTFSGISVKSPESIRHKKKDGREINVEGLDSLLNHETFYKIIGELGYRENIWKNYEETIKFWEKRDKEWEKWCQENITNYNNNQPSQPQNPTPSTSNPSTIPNREPKPENPNTPSSDQNKWEQSPTKPTNPLPTSTDIQAHYDTDKTQTEINNNPNLTDNQEKDQTQKLSKILITAESLIQKKQFNPEVLTKLTTEKKQNTPLYQLLNKEGRIDKAISQLQSLEKENKPVANNPDKNSFPSKIVLVSLLLSVVGVIGTIALFRKKKVRKKV